MLDNRKIYPRAKVSLLKVADPKLAPLWALIQGKITSARYASIIFQEQKVLESRGIGGFFTERKFVNILYISDKYLDAATNTLNFDSDEDLAIFIHECSHFLHLSANGGKFLMKDVGDLPPLSAASAPTTKQRYLAEREAWFRSLGLNRCFRLGLEDAINAANANNMLALEKCLGKRSESTEELKKMAETMTIDDFKPDWITDKKD